MKENFSLHNDKLSVTTGKLVWEASFRASYAINTFVSKYILQKKDFFFWRELETKIMPTSLTANAFDKFLTITRSKDDFCLKKKTEKTCTDRLSIM